MHSPPHMFGRRMVGTLLAATLLWLLTACGETERPEETAPAADETPNALPVDAPAEPIPTYSMNPPETLYRLTARSLGFQLELVDVRIVDGEVWTLARLHYPTGMVGMALEELELRAALPTDTPVGRHFVLGEAQGIFEPPADILWIPSEEALPPEWSGGVSVPQP